MRQAPAGVKTLASIALLMSVGGGLAWANLDGPHGRFRSVCEPSHTNSDDPIVFPGKPGLSHRHQYFGARGTDAFARSQRLRRGATSCRRSKDTAAYWVPTLEVEGRVVKPLVAQAYYTAGGKSRDLVKPFPPGFRVVAGRADATRPQPEHKVTWYCVAPPQGWNSRDGLIGWALFVGAHRRIVTANPYCDQPGGSLSIHIRFPDCWDGRRLDSPNHRQHVRYSERHRGSWRATCPDSHPVSIPQIAFSVHYPTRGHLDTSEVELSSGGSYSGHADFINSWDQSELEQLVRRCINQSTC